jgi:uncharacterized protein YbbC (DUF1343 family)
VRVVPIRFTPTSSKFEGKECGGLNFVITDWQEFRSFELGLIVAKAVRALHRDEWETDSYMRLLGNADIHRRIVGEDDVDKIMKLVERQVLKFRERRKAFELYP